MTHQLVKTWEHNDTEIHECLACGHSVRVMTKDGIMVGREIEILGDMSVGHVYVNMPVDDLSLGIDLSDGKG